MIMKFLLLFFIILLVMLLYLINIIVSKKSKLSREMSSSFECGFDPFKTARVPFSLHFFVLMVIFLVFDLEIVLLFPFPLIESFNSLYILFSFSFFLFVLFFGTVHEWLEGTLDWV